MFPQLSATPLGLQVLECITQYLELGSYLEWSEEQRCAFLLAELQGRRPLLPPGMDMNADVKEVVDTFRWGGGWGELCVSCA